MRQSFRFAAVAFIVAASACSSGRTPDPQPPTASVPSAHDALRARMQLALDSLAARAAFPGAVAAVALPDGSVVSVATGQTEADGRALESDDRMLAGSVGKTFFAALALVEVRNGRLDLDAPISRYLADEPWFDRLPNARDITVRMLMNHTSGIERYEFDPRVGEALVANPDRVWTPLDRISYILDSDAPFAAGAGWVYSDTNYIVLGVILEKIVGRDLYDEIQRRFIGPLALANTIPSNARVLEGVVQGYAGPGNPFGGSETMIGADGRLAFNPQMEWAGGGYASTAGDLARWARLLYRGDVVGAAMLTEQLGTVSAPQLGAGAGYGLGVIVRTTELGVARGHSGFFPGWITEVYYFPALDVAAAVQYNTSVGRQLGGPPLALLTRLAALAGASHGGS